MRLAGLQRINSLAGRQNSSDWSGNMPGMLDSLQTFGYHVAPFDALPLAGHRGSGRLNRGKASSDALCGIPVRASSS